MKLWEVFKRGLWSENAIFRQVLGMCPTLAVTNAVVNGLYMGLATAFVLVCSSTVVSLIKRFIPAKVRIPSYVVVIATFVTIADLVLAATVPDIHKVLGLFVPLIVVNCLILGRSEAFASKNPVYSSFVDALGMGLGFTWALLLLSTFREILGMGTWFGIQILGQRYTPIMIFVLPPGAFLALGILLGGMNWLSTGSLFRFTRREKEEEAPSIRA